MFSTSPGVKGSTKWDIIIYSVCWLFQLLSIKILLHSQWQWPEDREKIWCESPWDLWSNLTRKAIWEFYRDYLNSACCRETYESLLQSEPQSLKETLTSLLLSPLFCVWMFSVLLMCFSGSPPNLLPHVPLSALLSSLILLSPSTFCHLPQIRRHASRSKWRRSSGGLYSLPRSAPPHLVATQLEGDQSNMTLG